MNRWVQTGGDFVSRQFKRNGIRFQPLVIPEVASLELFVSVALVLGLALAIRHRAFRPCYVLPIFGLMAIAVIYTKGGTLGRSFAGFFLLLFPVAMPALARLPRRILSAYAALCLLVGIGVIVTDPSRPLLPLRYLSNKLAGNPAAAAQLAGFAHYSERQFATRALLSSIPEDETAIGIILEPNSPFGGIWISRPELRVIPYSSFPSATRLDSDDVRFLLFKSMKPAPPDGIPDEGLLAFSSIEPLSTIPYVSFTHKGPEPWTLLTKRQR